MSGESKTAPFQLPLMQCLLLDMPDDGIDCSIHNETDCLFCPFLGKFATGESMDDYGSPSHVLCFIIGVIVVIIGVVGALANILIMIVLKRQKSDRGFDTMLIGLAAFDLICSVASIIAAMSNVSYYQNFGRGIVDLHLYYLATQTAIFARSASSFQTVLITLERYLCVAFPIQTSNWFTIAKSQLLTLGIFVFAFALAFPRYSSNYVGENIVGKDMESTKHLEYLILSTGMEGFWYSTMGRFFDHIDFYVPLPVLLVLNGLIYVHILRFMARRKDLNMKQKKDIRAIRMFLPVVIVLFLCNIFPIIDNVSLAFFGVLHHEVYMGLLLSYVCNSAANLPIYYYRGSSFQKETKALLFSVFPSMDRYFSKGCGDDNSGARETTTMMPSANNNKFNEKGKDAIEK